MVFLRGMGMTQEGTGEGLPGPSVLIWAVHMVCVQLASVSWSHSLMICTKNSADVDSTV